MGKLSNNDRVRIRIYAKKIILMNSLGGECSKCGEKRYHLLNFHHKDSTNKEFTICFKRNDRFSKLLKEVQKCELLCYNCHHERHNVNELKYKQNKIIFLNYLGYDGCSNCGNNNVKMISFHHTRDKLFRISDVMRNRKITNSFIPIKIKTELDKCVPLCFNCHMDFHHDKIFYEKHSSVLNFYLENMNEIKPVVDETLILNLAKSGKRVGEIAKELDICNSSVCRVFKKYNLSKPKSEILLDKEKLLSLCNDNKTIREISIEMNKSYDSIWNICKRLNIYPKKEINLKRKDLNITPDILYEMLETMTILQIAEHFKTSRKNIYDKKKRFDRMKNNI